jgi:S1-C subfamily serine protease
MRPYLAIAFLLVGCAVVPQQNVSFMQARASTIEVDDLSGSHGTGVMVNEYCAVTAAHVADRDVVLGTVQSGHQYGMIRRAYDDAQDVAAICATVPVEAPPVTFGPTPATYDPVFTVGFPLMFHDFLTEGRWQDNNSISADCAPGNSGGGVFNASGQDVGFVDAIAAYDHAKYVFPHLCVVAPSPVITAFLDKNGIHYHGRS